MTAPPRVTLADILVYLAPVYFGPFLAGLAKTTWLVPAIIAVMGLALSSRVRPPNPLPGAALAVRVLVFLLHTGLVAGSYLLGLGLAEAGARLPLPVWLPIGTSFAVGIFALWRLNLLVPSAASPPPGVDPAPGVEPEPTPSEPAPRLTSNVRDQIPSPGLHDALHRLWPAEATPDAVDPILAQITAATPPDKVFAALIFAMDEGSDAVDLAAMRFLHAPDARAAALRDGRLPMALALGVTSFSDRVRHDACEVAYALIADGAGPKAFPPKDRLHGIGKTFADTAETMAAIAAHLGEGDRTS